MQILKTAMKKQNLRIFSILFLLIISSCCKKCIGALNKVIAAHCVSSEKKYIILWNTLEIFISDNNNVLM